MANFNKSCLLLSRLSSGMISSIINNVSLCTNNSHNFSIQLYSRFKGTTLSHRICQQMVSLGFISKALSSFLIQSLEWYVLFHWSVGQIMIMQSKWLLYSFSINLKTRWVFPFCLTNEYACVRLFDIVVRHLFCLMSIDSSSPNLVNTKCSCKQPQKWANLWRYILLILDA